MSRAASICVGAYGDGGVGGEAATPRGPQSSQSVPSSQLAEGWYSLPGPPSLHWPLEA